jgi:transposase-like protein
MNASSAAAKLPEAERKKLALRSLSGSESVTQLSEQHGVSRKFVYDQVHKGQ